MASEPLFCPHCGAVYALDEKQCNFCQYIFTEELDSFDASDLFHERYQILNQIGTGGFGAVYQARDTQAQQRLVAIKQINLRGLTAQEIIEATDGFNREREFLSSLTHDHLPRIYDHFMDAEHWYLIMEFIDGETLETYLQSMSATASLVRTLSVDEIVDISLQLCDVLSYLHGQLQPIIFRDLKPSNVMRTDRGALYLIDFGIARYFKPGKLKDTIPFGSPGYAAPEQYGKGQTTAQADIYSLGALLYYMLSGLDPAESPFHFAPLRLYGTAGLVELEALIMQMVALDAQQRPSDVQVVTLELQKIRRLRGNPEQRIWHPQSPQNPIGAAPVAGSSPYWPGSTGQSGQQQFQMSQPFAQPPGAGTPGIGRRKLIKKGWQIGLAVGIGSILFHNVVFPSHSSPSVDPGGLIQHSPDPIEASVPDLQPGSPIVGTTGANLTQVLHAPTGQLFAVAGQDKNVFIWSTRIPAWIDKLPVPQAATSLSWSLDGNYLAVASGRSVYIWATPADNNKNMWGLSSKPWVVHPNILPATLQTVSWDPIDPMTLAVSDIDGNVQVFNLSYEDGSLSKQVYKLDADPSKGRLPSGPQMGWADRQLYSLLDRNHVDVWNSEAALDRSGYTITLSGLKGSVQEVLWLSLPADPLNAIVLTVDGHLSFVNVDSSGNYQVSQSSLVGTVIKAITYSYRHGYVFGLAKDGIYIWPVESLGDPPQFYPQLSTIHSAMLSIDYFENEDIVIVGGDDGLLQIWSVQ